MTVITHVCVYVGGVWVFGCAVFTPGRNNLKLSTVPRESEKKQDTLAHNFATYLPIFKIHPPADSAVLV